MTIAFGPRRAELDSSLDLSLCPLSDAEVEHYEHLDLIYRSLCALLYNYAPESGHPGGSISSGRIVQSVLFQAMDYDVSNPDRRDADMISYAAGHKALGLYSIWALRDEMVRVADPDLLPGDIGRRLRLEDLLGFRRNPTTTTPLFRRFESKALDGHPTPTTPFVRLSTGASGVGIGSSFGLALGAMDLFGANAPRLHVIEGEGGLTPGRVAEALAFAGTAGLSNTIVHVDWNQASIDSNRVTRDGATPGDYVQWDPCELFYLHDWNVVLVEDGADFRQVQAAQARAATFENDQPTAIVYRTIKGWQYGIEGRASHGAGHKMCSTAFHKALSPLTHELQSHLPACEVGESRCAMGSDAVVVEHCLWEALLLIRKAVESRPTVAAYFAGRLRGSIERLDERARSPREGAPRIEAVYDIAAMPGDEDLLAIEPWTSTTLRGQLGRVLGHLNRKSGGALMVGSADLLASTSIKDAASGFPDGFFHTKSNPNARAVAFGGICEDAMTAILSGLSTFGGHIGAGSSYGAFIAPLGHIASRLHAIGAQARHEASGDPYRPMIVICGHAGLKTGEDGPTHADPQPLQLLQENFPRGTMITLTPWDPNEISHLVYAALSNRPAVIAPFVTRPNETVMDREKLGLAPASEAAKGVYRLRRAEGKADGVVVLQESAVTNAFVEHTLRMLSEDGIDLDVYYVASAELFDLLPREERDAIFPESAAMDAMGITGFTLPTMYRWIRSDLGRSNTLHPYVRGHYPGSGNGRIVLAEAGLHADGQYTQIHRYVEERKRRTRPMVSVTEMTTPSVPVG